MLTLNNLSSPKGANRNTKRLGRGQASGQGTQAGKGHKGQKARSGGGVRTGFEGGNMPLYMRLPKRGFSNAPFKNDYTVVRIRDIDQKVSSGDVSKQTLLDVGLINKNEQKGLIKVIGSEKLSNALNFIGIDKVSKGAASSIESAGGKVQS